MDWDPSFWVYKATLLVTQGLLAKLGPHVLGREGLIPSVLPESLYALVHPFAASPGPSAPCAAVC
ncbi:unnamed protein product [Prunus armeniaca]